MRIAVTGATGNVGTALLRAFTADGHDVVGVARRPPREGAYATAEWHSIDLTDAPAGALETAFAGADAVVHLAWGFQPTRDEGYLERLALEGTAAVLAAASAAGVGHVLHQSSMGAYSPGDGLVDESHPVNGVAASAYSRHKAGAERLLDSFEAEHPDVTVTRMRPVLIGQRSAASGLMRYTMPPAVPAGVVRLAKLLPLDRDLRLQFVHADDVADAYRLAIAQRAGGAFNLAADPVLTPRDVAEALGARHVHVPLRLVQRAADLGWRLHLQPVDVGWLEMAGQLPQLDAGRARRELGWTPRHDARSVLAEVVDGIRSQAYDDTPILRPRRARDELLGILRGRPASRRPVP